MPGNKRMSMSNLLMNGPLDKIGYQSNLIGYASHKPNNFSEGQGNLSGRAFAGRRKADQSHRRFNHGTSGRNMKSPVRGNYNRSKPQNYGYDNRDKSKSAKRRKVNKSPVRSKSNQYLTLFARN